MTHIILDMNIISNKNCYNSRNEYTNIETHRRNRFTAYYEWMEKNSVIT